ncbi:hypothetical protein AB4851_28860 [Burkholderia sp. 22PA0099]|uniref:hypothetical protein n=1 Tax=unclassified Burkholderia TaxID=2613784 RepID=UPI0039C13C21
MTTYSPQPSLSPPALHVFEQDGAWHWGITVPRAAGSGFKLIAFSEKTFAVESAARIDGGSALASLADIDSRH